MHWLVGLVLLFNASLTTRRLTLLLPLARLLRQRARGARGHGSQLGILLYLAFRLLNGQFFRTMLAKRRLALQRF